MSVVHHKICHNKIIEYYSTHLGRLINNIICHKLQSTDCLPFEGSNQSQLPLSLLPCSGSRMLAHRRHAIYVSIASSIRANFVFFLWL